jgi:hypothetical protein
MVFVLVPGNRFWQIFLLILPLQESLKDSIGLQQTAALMAYLYLLYLANGSFRMSVNILHSTFIQN